MVFRLCKFFKRPTRELHNDVIAGGSIEVKRAVAPVGNILEIKSGGKTGGNAGDREAGGFRRKRTGTGRTRIDLNHDDTVVNRIVGKLNIAASDNTDAFHNAVCVILKTLLHGFRNGQHRCHAEAVAGMNSHGIHIFDEADCDFLAGCVADDLQFQFLPADHALFHQNLMDHAGVKTAGTDFAEFLHIVDDTAAGSAHRIRRTQNDGIAELVCDLLGFLQRVAGLGLRHRHAQLFHRLFERDTVLTALDRFKVHADDFHVVFTENSGLIQSNGEVQGGLTAKIREKRVGTFLLNNFFETVDRQGLDVSVIRHTGVGHDRRGVRVHKNNFVAFVTKSLASLCA